MKFKIEIPEKLKNKFQKKDKDKGKDLADSVIDDSAIAGKKLKADNNSAKIIKKTDNRERERERESKIESIEPKNWSWAIHYQSWNARLK